MKDRGLRDVLIEAGVIQIGYTADTFMEGKALKDLKDRGAVLRARMNGLDTENKDLKNKLRDVEFGLIRHKVLIAEQNKILKALLDYLNLETHEVKAHLELRGRR